MNEEKVKVEEEVKKVIISVTADSAKTEGSVRRNSTGKASTRTSPSLLSSDEKILPHYLRASTKSCHDFCKYGKSHVFEAKKRLPIRRSFPQRSSIRDEHKAVEVSAPKERRNSFELKVKTTSRTEVGLSDKVKGIKKLGLKEKESFEASKSTKLQTPLLSNEGKELSKGLVSIETATPIPIHQMEELSEASETAELESNSPTEKRIISPEPTTHLAWSEGSSDGSESMELDSPSAQLGKLYEEPLRVEISTPSPGIVSMAFADEVAGSKPTTPSSITKSLKAGSAKSRPSSSEERSSEKTSSVKLKTPSPNHKSGTATEKRATSKNLKVVEVKKRELTKPEVSDRIKAINKKRIESTMQSRIIKKSPSPSLVEKPKIVEQKNPLTMKKVVMSVSPKIIKNKVLSISNNISTPSKPSISLKQKVPVVRSTPTLMSSRKLTAQKDTGNKIIRSVELSKPRASLSTKLPVKVKNQVKVGTPEHTNEKVKEKTLYVIEPKTLKTDPKPTNKEPKKNKPTSSSHTRTASSSSSSSSSSLSRSTLSESKRSKPVRSPKRDEKRKPIRTTIHTEPKLPSPHKLKFQRGKTVSPNTENNSPRKLKFRQAKVVSETPNNKEAVRKNFMRRRRVSIGSRAELTSPGLKAPAVVLKHQDVQEKKEIQGLLNHVIEETASKLVETRKSKVKALVGAFETVISLQESRVTTSTS